MSKYYYDESYFEKIDTNEKAYWLGFLYADGCIVTDKRRNNSKHLELSLCKKDARHLKKFLYCLKSDAIVHFKKSKCGNKEYESCRINIYNKKICEDLINLGCVPRKTYDLKFPSHEIVSKKFLKDFLRGFFDGDGCINVSNNTIKLNIAGTLDMLQEIGHYLVENDIVISIPTLSKDKRKNSLYQLWIYGVDNVKNVLDYLYKDSSMFLDRKFDLYSSFYKNYVEEKDHNGIYYDKRINKYISNIRINGKSILRYSKTFNEALLKRKSLEKQKMNLELARLSSNGYDSLRGIKRESPSY